MLYYVTIWESSRTSMKTRKEGDPHSILFCTNNCCLFVKFEDELSILIDIWEMQEKMGFGLPIALVLVKKEI